ncbi:MAG TPA: hypothetical protein ENI87_01095 [bacterium]|nr:hypothetical protein [bacterium]
MMKGRKLATLSAMVGVVLIAIMVMDSCGWWEVSRGAVYQQHDAPDRQGDQQVMSVDAVERSLVVDLLSVSTVSEAGDSVENAEVFWAAKREPHYYHGNSLQLLGKTDSRGVAQLKPCKAGVLLVRHPDYSPAEVQVAPDTRSLQVELARGGSVKVRCVDPVGAPVQGVRAMVGMGVPRQLAVDSEDVGWQPSGAQETAVWMGVSDETGSVTFSGLPRGAMGCRVLHDRLVMLGVEPVVVEPIPGERVEVVATLAPIEGILFFLTNDRGDVIPIRNWGARSPRGYTTPVMASDVLTARRQELADAHPMACAVLWARAGSGDLPALVKVDVMTSENGWRVVRPTIRPLAELMVPEALRVTGGQACVECALDLVDSLGRYWEGVPIELSHDRDPPMTVVSGVPGPVPPGRYRVRLNNGLVGSALASDEVWIGQDSGSRVPLKLSKPLRRLRIRVECPGREAEELSGMVFLTTGDRGSFVSELRGGALEILSTDGPLECTVDLVGGRRLRKLLTISESQTEVVMSFE